MMTTTQEETVAAASEATPRLSPRREFMEVRPGVWVSVRAVTSVHGAAYDDDYAQGVLLVDGEPVLAVVLLGNDRREESVYGVEGLLAAIEAAAPGEPLLPDDCRARTCGYYQGYLAHGSPDMTHEGYHALEALAEQHRSGCDRRGKMLCGRCTDYELRLRY